MVRDLVATDRQLEELGQEPSDVAALLGRCLGDDRSLQRLDGLLEQLGQGGPGRSEPPRASVRAGIPARKSRRPRSRPPATRSSPSGKGKSARDTLVGVPPQPALQPPEAAPEAQAAELAPRRPSQPFELQTGDTGEPEPTPEEAGEPELSWSEQEAAAEEPTEVAASGNAPSEQGGESWQGADARGGAELEEVTGRSSWVPPAAEPERDPGRAESLLDQDLDPADFPPDEAGADEPTRVEPEVLEIEDADEDDFELLIDDEEILEIEDLEDEG